MTLRDIAAVVGIRHASLYHHAPGGKEQLFIEVTERNLQRHADGLRRQYSGAEPGVRAQLQAIAHWLLTNPPMDLVRMTHSDLPAIEKGEAERLAQLVLHSLIEPVIEVLRQAQARGEIEHTDLGLVGGGVVGLVESLHAIPSEVLTISRVAMADVLIDVLLYGLLSGESRRANAATMSTPSAPEPHQRETVTPSYKK